MRLKEAQGRRDRGQSTGLLMAASPSANAQGWAGGHWLNYKRSVYSYCKLECVGGLDRKA